jgi:SNF2 family DNA or RNA helicase
MLFIHKLNYFLLNLWPSAELSLRSFRYPVIPTVLTRIHWWRLCLDEAQMVESGRTSVTEMALRLNAQHRWCITGTPIQRKLDDLFGLLRFLRTNPFDTYRWWVDIIRDPYEVCCLLLVNLSHTNNGSHCHAVMFFIVYKL